eukprot:CAMPEP_0180692098 /NCGR_PEP_ID=MMETSP1038_2-20121128/634_1 /TAXON_ID=632150 /ORGANISM="Azadinium spinosum, Strain 3D9" /LENGTH=124 /DNA_ID=CAMNT_0022723227 /DNA_START=497 /DNA_END=868 /DNA_ORIENTATION=+
MSPIQDTLSNEVDEEDNAMHQRNRLVSKIFHTGFLSSSSTSSSMVSALVPSGGGAAAGEAPANSSAEGKPNFSGASFMTNKHTKPVTIAMHPGTIMPNRQLYVAAKPPAIKGMKKPPKLWDAFH